MQAAFSNQSWDEVEGVDDSINQYCRELMSLVDRGQVDEADAKQAMDNVMALYRSLIELLKSRKDQAGSQLKRLQSEKEAIRQYSRSTFCK